MPCVLGTGLPSILIFFPTSPLTPMSWPLLSLTSKEPNGFRSLPNTLKCRIERDGPVLVSFFGGLGLGQVAPRDQVEGKRFYVASLLDIAGMKVAVVQKRAEAKDYLDIDALIQHGIDLPTALAAGRIVYGRSFNPMITLKALSFFDDVPTLPAEVRRRLKRCC